MTAREERGAVLPLLAATVTLLVGVAAFGVDLGMQRVARGDMQAVADVVALDVARLVDGRTLARIKAPLGVDGKQPLASVLAASKVRNRASVGATPDIDVYFVDAAADGSYTTASGLPVQVPDGAVPNAVVAIARTEVEFGLARVMGVSKGSASRSALAATRSSACFDLGSYAARLNTADPSLLNGLLSPLTKLLHLNAALDVGSYKALAGASVSLAGIAAAPTIGTPDAVVGAMPITIQKLLDATVYALQHDPQTSTTNAAAAISALALLKGSLTLPLDTALKLGDVVAVDVGDAAALATKVSVLDLVASAIGLANGANFLETGMSLSVPGLGTSSVRLKVLQGKLRVCGEPNSPTAVGRQSQISLDTTVGPSTGATLNTLGLTTKLGPVIISGGIGNGEARLVSPDPIVCASGTSAAPDTYSVRAGAGLLGLGVSVPVSVDGTVSVLNNPSLGLPPNLLTDLLQSLLGLVGSAVNPLVDVKLKFTDVDLNLGTDIPGTDPAYDTRTLSVPANTVNGSPTGTPATFRGAPQLLNPVALGIPLSGSIELEAKLLLTGSSRKPLNLSVPVDVTLLNKVLGAILTPTIDAVNATVTNLQSSVVSPLATLLGLDVAGVDIYSVARPSCSAPRLIG